MKIKIMLVFAFLLLLSGCTSVKSQKASKPLFRESYAQMISSKYFNEIKDSGKTFYGINKYRDLFEKCLSQGGTEPLNRAKRLRDEVIYDLMTLSDYLYDEYKWKIFRNKSMFDAGAKIIDLALTGTAAAFGGEATKTSLSAAATFLSGSKETIDKNFFAQQTVTTIIVVMDGNRAKVKARLIKSLEQQANEYTLVQGLKDIQEYHGAGSMLDAIISLGREAGSEAGKQKAVLDKVADNKAKISDEVEKVEDSEEQEVKELAEN